MMEQRAEMGLLGELQRAEGVRQGRSHHLHRHPLLRCLRMSSVEVELGEKSSEKRRQLDERGAVGGMDRLA